MACTALPDPVSKTIFPPSFTDHPKSNCCLGIKQFGFAIAVIVGIVGLSSMVIGLQGYFKGAVMSPLTPSQIQDISCLAVGSAGFTIIALTGLVGCTKGNQLNEQGKRLDTPQVSCIWFLVAKVLSAVASCLLCTALLCHGKLYCSN